MMNYPEQYPQYPQQEEKRKNEDSITKIAAKGAFLSFHNSLHTAIPDEACMLHGCGGKDHGFRSGISMRMCHYEGGKSENASINIPPYLTEIWADVAKSNIGTYLAPVQEANALSALNNAESMTRGILPAVAIAMHRFLAAISRIIQGNTPPMQEFGAALNDACQNITAQPMFADIVPTGVRRDYAYKQTRCNIHKKLEGGYSSCAELTVQRNTVLDGQLRSKPWFFKITNFEAQTKTNANGTINYIPSTVRNKVEVKIMATDEDVFMAAEAVNHFVKIWETSFCVYPLQLLQQRMDAERQQRA